MSLVDITAVNHNHTRAFNPTAILQLMLPFNLPLAVEELKLLVAKQLVIQVVILFPIAFVEPAEVCQIVLVHL